MATVHGDQNPEIAKFSCPNCPGLFVVEKSFNLHIRWHKYKDESPTESDEPENVEENKSEKTCIYCQHHFTRRSNFVNHMEIVHGNQGRLLFR